MQRSSLYILWLIAGMILTGTTNTLLLKYQDMQCVENCSDPNPRKHAFYAQPMLQSLQMFLGQMLCFLPTFFTWIWPTWGNPTPMSHHSRSSECIQGKQNSLSVELQGRKLLFLWPPAICCLAGATLLHIGLLYVPVSIYQMARGALVLLVGTFSVIFLKRRLSLYQWISLLIVVAGVLSVGYCASLIQDSKTGVGMTSETTSRLVPAREVGVSKGLVGVFLILLAQVFIASRFVIEEKIMSRWIVRPIDVAAFEGLFGVMTIMLLMPVMMPQSISSLFPYFDLTRGWHQILDNPRILWIGMSVAFSVALYNFFCLSVTRHMSATTRSLADTCRTLFVWLFGLTLGWEQLLFPISLLQVFGFSIMIYGTLSFNNVVPLLPFLQSSPTNIAPKPMVVVEEADTEAFLSHPTPDESTALLSGTTRSTSDSCSIGRHARGTKKDHVTPSTLSSSS